MAAREDFVRLSETFFGDAKQSGAICIETGCLMTCGTPEIISQPRRRARGFLTFDAPTEFLVPKREGSRRRRRIQIHQPTRSPRRFDDSEVFARLFASIHDEMSVGS
jgi:hypothetical protein